jgi:hypothetical protein
VAGDGAIVEVRSHPGPHVLHFAQEDSGTGITNRPELLEYSCGGGDIVLAAVRDFAQVTGELVADPLRDVGEPGGRAFVVAHVVGPTEGAREHQPLPRSHCGRRRHAVAV